jgi:DNA-binding NtrC family response regulator
MPRDTPQPADAIDPADDVQPPARVLVVDDDEAIRDLYSQVLADMGFLVDVAGDGDEGLEALRLQPYSVIITDIKMPRVSGFEFWAGCENVRPGSGKRFIFTTGCLDILTTSEFGVLGERPCIEKPATIDDIQSAVVELLRTVGVLAG